MKKTVFLFVLVLAVFMFCSVSSCRAADKDALYKQYSDQFLEQVPDSIKDDIEDGSGSTLTDTLSHVFDTLKTKWKSLLINPISIIAKLAAMSLIVSVAESFTKSPKGTVNMVGGAVAAVVVVSISGGYIGELLSTIESMRDLSYSFVPSFAAVCASGGMVASSALYSAAAIGCTGIVCSLITYLVPPLIGILLSISLASVISTEIDLQSFASSAAKCAKWILSLGMTVFLLINTLQTTVAGYSDASALAAGRFMFSSAVPVVGSSLAESGAAIFGSLRVVKGAVGTAGIASLIALCVMPVAQFMLNALAQKLKNESN